MLLASNRTVNSRRDGPTISISIIDKTIQTAADNITTTMPTNLDDQSKRQPQIEQKNVAVDDDIRGAPILIDLT